MPDPVWKDSGRHYVVMVIIYYGVKLLSRGRLNSKLKRQKSNLKLKAQKLKINQSFFNVAYLDSLVSSSSLILSLKNAAFSNSSCFAACRI